MASMYFQHTSPRVWDYLEQMDANWAHESSILSNDNVKSGELTWGAQLSYFPKQKPVSARPRSSRRQFSDASRGSRSEFLVRRDPIVRDRSASGSSFSSVSTSSGLSFSPSSYDGPTDLSSVIQNLSSQLGFDLNETFNCAKKYSRPVKSAKTTPATTPVAASPKTKAAKPSNVRHEFVVQVPHVQKPATTVEYDSMMSALNTPVKSAPATATAGVNKMFKPAYENARTKKTDAKDVKRTRKVSFADSVQELPILIEAETETEPEMILDDGGSDSDSDSDSVPEAVFLNVETVTQSVPRARHVEIRDAEEEEKDYITIYHS